MNLHISEEARRFVAAEVASGRYASEEDVIEDALRRMRQQEQPSPAGRTLDNDPLWGMFRDEPELIDQIVQDAMRDRHTIPLRATGDAHETTRAEAAGTEPQEERLPGPFLEDEAIPAPTDLPRPGQAVARTSRRVDARYPDLFPGEELDGQHRRG